MGHSLPTPDLEEARLPRGPVAMLLAWGPWGSSDYVAAGWLLCRQAKAGGTCSHRVGSGVAFQGLVEEAPLPTVPSSHWAPEEAGWQA